ncbi:MAG: hypothetical protein ACREUV_03845 [Burkholderiales bacterium]
MYRLSAFLLSVVAMACFAEDHSITFSKYSPKLKLVSLDREKSVARFRGVVALTGTLFIGFDMAEPNLANGEVNFAKFVPDATSIVRLPAVVAGFYPSQVKYVLLEPSDSALEAVFGKKEAARLSHGTEHYVSRRVKVLIRNYTTSVECDSRGYSSNFISIEPLVNQQAAIIGGAPSGC